MWERSLVAVGETVVLRYFWHLISGAGDVG
jgi:thiamine transporter ThiT